MTTISCAVQTAMITDLPRPRGARMGWNGGHRSRSVTTAMRTSGDGEVVRPQMRDGRRLTTALGFDAIRRSMTILPRRSIDREIAAGPTRSPARRQDVHVTASDLWASRPQRHDHRAGSVQTSMSGDLLYRSPFSRHLLLSSLPWYLSVCTNSS